MLIYEQKYNHSCVIGGKTIKFKPWNTKNEKDFLIATESEENISNELLFDILIKPCMEEPSILLDNNEQKLLMIEIRKKSLGDTFPLKYSCNKCNKINELEVDFESITSYKENKYEDITIEDITFHIGSPLTDKLKSRLDSTSSNIEYNFINVLIHIHAITVNGKKEDKFSFDELTKFMEDIPSNIFDELYTKFRDMNGSLEFTLKTFCMFCNNETIIDFEGIPNFLWG